MQIKSLKLQTRQLLPIVIHWYITSKKGGKCRCDVTLKYVLILVPWIILVGHTGITWSSAVALYLIVVHSSRCIKKF
jgi:hypothetical protein